MRLVTQNCARHWFVKMESKGGLVVKENEAAESVQGSGDVNNVRSTSKSPPNYCDVVIYRRAWCWYLLLFLFPPATLLIGLTGDVYRRKDEQVTLIPRWTILTISIFVLVPILIRLFA